MGRQSAEKADSVLPEENKGIIRKPDPAQLAGCDHQSLNFILRKNKEDYHGKQNGEVLFKRE